MSDREVEPLLLAGPKEYAMADATEFNMQLSDYEEDLPGAGLLQDGEDSSKDELEEETGSRKFSLFTVLLTALMLSIEYAVVIPSVWLFLKSLDPHVHEYMLGLVIGLYGVTSLVLQPVVGAWIDARYLKEVLVFQLWSVIIGNLVYFASWNVPMVLVSRLIAGIGGTVYLSVSVYIIRSTTEKQRSPAFSKLQACMMSGLILGPGLNYPLTLVPTEKIGWFTLSPYSVVGLVMAGLQLICVAILHLGFIEPPMPRASENAPTLTPLEGFKNVASVLSFPTLALMISQFSAVFSQSSLEVILTPLLIQYYSFTTIGNSLFYCVTSVYMIAVFAVVGGIFAKRLSDRVLMLCGWLCLAAGIVILLMQVGFIKPHLPLVGFAIGIAVFVTSMGFFESSVGSLFSKLVARQGGKQATSQAVLMMFQTLATILGPIVVSPIVSKGFLYVLIFQLGIWGVSCTFFLCAFPRLKVDEEIKEVPVSGDEGL